MTLPRSYCSAEHRVSCVAIPDGGFLFTCSICGREVMFSPSEDGLEVRVLVAGDQGVVHRGVHALPGLDLDLSCGVSEED